jgi:DNA replication and repair protein RecF
LSSFPTLPLPRWDRGQVERSTILGIMEWGVLSSMIKNIKLADFRNFKRKLIEFSPRTTVIVGPNASGKTNILESIFLASTGKSFRAKIEEEMITYDKSLARVLALLTSKNEQGKDILQSKLEVVLTRGEIEIGDDRFEKAPRKRLLVNGVSRRLMDFAGKLKVVLFGPQDLDLVTQSPAIRRYFLDTLLSQADREYRRAILSYEKGLRARNRLLYRIREEGLSRSQLLFWDRLLIKNGDYISGARGNFINYANQTEGLNDQLFSLEYDRNAISEARLEQYAQEEVAAATTLVGPHRDDFQFKIQNSKFKIPRNLSHYGSRGEQRMGVLWLKLAELSFVEKMAQDKPTLLLDDIFSELDNKHRDIVVKAVGERQSIITTADGHYLESFKVDNLIKL